MKKTKIIKIDEVKSGWQRKDQAKERWLRGKWMVGGGFNDDFSQPFADETDGRIPF